MKQRRPTKDDIDFAEAQGENANSAGVSTKDNPWANRCPIRQAAWNRGWMKHHAKRWQAA